MASLKTYLPFLSWLPGYGRETLTNDTVAALIVTVMLIPQSLAYALLAGLPAEVGLYASILPLFAYTVFGTSRTLAVGPVAVVSLMTAAAVGAVAEQGTAEYLEAAITLGFLSGLMLTLMGLLRLGFFANFLSHPVISGFITASGLIIAASQLGQILGIQASGHTLVELGVGLFTDLHRIHWITAAIGTGTLLFLLWTRRCLKPLLEKAGIASRPADLLAKAGPVFAVVGTTVLTWALELDQSGVSMVGVLPGGLPSLTWPQTDLSLVEKLWIPALLISTVGFVESVSVAQTLAAKRRQRILPDQELIGLGAANLGSALSGGFPVRAGSPARWSTSMPVRKRLPLGAFAALGIAVVTIFLTPLIMYRPKATLAATIIVAVLSLVDFGALKRTLAYSLTDFLALMATIVLTLIAGVEAGLMTGVGLSLAMFLYQTSRPHSALLGRLPGTEHFRNIERFEVETDPALALLRIDESLYFANARFLEDRVYNLAASNDQLTDVVLVCPAVNHIDASALESLEAINSRLRDAGVRLHLTEVKGPVMDHLKHTQFYHELTGEVFLATYGAWQALRPSTNRAISGEPFKTGASEHDKAPG